MNTKEIVEAVTSITVPAPTNHGDCFKLRLANYRHFKLLYGEQQPVVRDHDLAPTPVPMPLMGSERYSAKIGRNQISHGAEDACVTISGVVKVDVFVDSSREPRIQPISSLYVK